MNLRVVLLTAPKMSAHKKKREIIVHLYFANTRLQELVRSSSWARLWSMCYPLSSTTKRSGHQSFSRKRTHPVEGATSVDRRRRIRYKKSISKKSSPATTIDSDSDLGRFSYIRNLLVTPVYLAWFVCAALKSPSHILKTTFYSFECCAAPYTICA